jgi:AraC family transcriptional regulator
MQPARQLRELPPTRTISGALPQPLLSSRSRGWNGIVVELQSFRDIDAVVQMQEHVVAVHLAGSISLLQRRNGKSSRAPVGPGDIIITPVGEPKRWQHSGENVVILLRLAPAFVQNVAGEEFALDPTRFEIQDNFGTRDTQIEEIGKHLLAGLEREGAASRIYAESLATQLTIHLLRHYSTANIASQRPPARLSRHKLLRAIEYIDENLREDLTLPDIAEALAMSPSHFAHAFRHTTGLPPHRYVLDRRIERAKALLRETDLPITEIAHRIGCASHSHFSAMFHRGTGQTPRDFRNGE